MVKCSGIIEKMLLLYFTRRRLGLFNALFKKKKRSTSFYQFMTGCQLENWTEQLITLLIRGTKIRILEKMGQMIMKTVSVTKHAIILNIHIHSHYCT